jgi:hypothetical protein
VRSSDNRPEPTPLVKLEVANMRLMNLVGGCLITLAALWASASVAVYIAKSECDPREAQTVLSLARTQVDLEFRKTGRVGAAMSRLPPEPIMILGLARCWKDTGSSHTV